MHPVNKNNYGATGIQVTYYNGTATVPGWIVKQTGTSKFIVTSDGVHLYTCVFAPTTAIATSLGSAIPPFVIPAHTLGVYYMTIPFTNPSSTTEYVKSIYDTTVVTTANNRYPWTFGGTSFDGGIVLPSAPAPVKNLVVTSPIAGEAVLTFTPPAVTTGVSYLVQYRDITGSGSLQTISPAPTASPVTKTGLTSTHNYFFSVAAMTTAGTSPAVTTTFIIT